MSSPMSAQGTSEPLQRIKIALIEGTARSIRHQQHQLNKLYNGLLKARSELQEALQQEHALSESEALFEHSLALEEVRTHYNGISLDRENSKNTRIERSEDNSDHTCPYGIVYIIPSPGLYSVTSAVVAALVAGNCVILELPQTTSRLTASIRDLLNETLSRDTFSVATYRMNLDSIDSCVTVYQKSVDNMPRNNTQTITPIQGKVVSFVDRDADIALAAQSIFQSRFRFGGKSAYATDVAFVHEAAMDIFKRHFAQLWIELSFSRRNTKATRLQQEEHEGFVTIQTGSPGAVIEVADSSNFTTLPEFANSTLTLCSMSSTDSGIDICTAICDQGAPAAAFIFAGPGSANYLARQIEAQLTIVNHIPLELLVGPRISSASSKEIFPRFSPTMFQHYRPQLSKGSQISNEAGGTVLDNVKLLSWANSLQKPMPKSGEKDGKRVDFFEQGIMTAAGISLFTVLAITVTVVIRKRIWN